MLRSAIALAALASTTAGCRAFDPDPELRSFSDCDEMQAYMQKVARTEARWDYAFQWDGSVGMEESFVMTTDSAGAMDADSSGGASSYSSTNLQEADVDEDDLVKTDGTYLYTLAGSTLTISRAWPLEDAGLLGTVEIDGSAQGIYLTDDRVIVLSALYVWEGDGAAPRSGAVLGRKESGEMTLVTVVDVSDPTAPEVVRETYATGAFKESRRIDDRLYVVTYQSIDVTTRARNFREAKAAIRDADKSDWLPWLQDNRLSAGAWETAEDDACGCTDLWASAAESGTLLTNVLSLDLSDPDSAFDGEAVVGRADTVYASSNAIYVGFSEWDDGAFPSLDDQVDTILHKFDISDAEAHPAYLASAKIPGQLDDQFGLSEYDGVLRIATTEIGRDWEQSSSVFTLREEQGQFAHLDELTGLAPGESIFAARFIGDIGYIVTYEQQLGDPLFTIDLSDPDHIRLAGELAVTGWSDYIHPMDADHLLTVGMEETGDWEWQLAMSLFDVSDIDNPVLADRLVFDATGSEAQDEHHAFLYFADAEVAAVPSWSLDGESVLEVVHATPDGLSQRGRVYQDAVLADAGVEDAWCANIRRSVVMDDAIWAVSNAGLTAAGLDAPDDVLASVPFPGLATCDDYYYW